MRNESNLPPEPEGVPAKAYASAPPSASADLAARLRGRIAAEGPLDFADFMAEALYHPDWGYYASGVGQVGRAGDFFTSVSVGPVFGGLLARRFLAWWRQGGRPPGWRITEVGAHDGTLAGDIIAALHDLDIGAWESLEYTICEPRPALMAAQRARLAAWPERVSWFTTPEEIAADPLPGVVFGNEVIDALPCQVVEWSGAAWHLCRVGLAEDGGFCWVRGEPTAGPVPGADLPAGYRTELRSAGALGAFLTPLLATLDHGLMLWIDYGFARPDYYHPARSEGTLRAYASHRVVSDPLQAPGAADLTAHVDFTTLAETAMSLGARVAAFRDQGAWLTAAGRDWLLEQEDRPDPQWIRQFQTLVHPGHLGGKFHALELAWRDPSLPPATAADLRRLDLNAGGP